MCVCLYVCAAFCISTFSGRFWETKTLSAIGWLIPCHESAICCSTAPSMGEPMWVCLSLLPSEEPPLFVWVNTTSRDVLPRRREASQGAAEEKEKVFLPSVCSCHSDSGLRTLMSLWLCMVSFWWGWVWMGCRYSPVSVYWWSVGQQEKGVFDTDYLRRALALFFILQYRSIFIPLLFLLFVHCCWRREYLYTTRWKCLSKLWHGFNIPRKRV